MLQVKQFSMRKQTSITLLILAQLVALEQSIKVKDQRQILDPIYS